VKKWCGFRVVLMRSSEKKWKSEKKLQKVNDFERPVRRWSDGRRLSQIKFSFSRKDAKTPRGEDFFNYLFLQIDKFR
jgi:hypothetical protein